MEFVTARPDIVGSNTQLWLLSHWHRTRGDALLPAWQGLEAAPQLMAMADNLGYAELVGTEESHRLLVTLQGARMIEAHGGYHVGKYLDEIFHPPYRQQSLETCRRSIVTRLPAYTVLDLRDHNQRIVHFERLLLPFGKDGRTVDGLMVSIEITSPEGPFEARNLMNPPARKPGMAICAMIQH